MAVVNVGNGGYVDVVVEVDDDVQGDGRRDDDDGRRDDDGRDVVGVA